MTEKTVTITIGGRDFVAGPMVLHALEQADPHIEALGKRGPLHASLRAACGIVAAALAVRDGALVADAPDIDRLSMLLLPDEQVALLAKTRELLGISGYIFTELTPGEDQAATASQPTGSGSSPN
jgi:hypothetical protein